MLLVFEGHPVYDLVMRVRVNVQKCPYVHVRVNVQKCPYVHVRVNVQKCPYVQESACTRVVSIFVCTFSSGIHECVSQCTLVVAVTSKCPTVLAVISKCLAVLVVVSKCLAVLAVISKCSTILAVILKCSAIVAVSSKCFDSQNQFTSSIFFVFATWTGPGPNAIIIVTSCLDFDPETGRLVTFAGLVNCCSISSVRIMLITGIDC